MEKKRDRTVTRSHLIRPRMYDDMITIYFQCDCRQLINKVCGKRGNDFLEATEQYCCQGSNSVGQVFFGILFIGCYLGVHTEIFPMLETIPEVGSWHRYVSFFLVKFRAKTKKRNSETNSFLFTFLQIYWRLHGYDCTLSFLIGFVL